MFEKAVTISPESFGNYSNLGAVLLYEGRYEEAVKVLQKSVAIRPTSNAYANAAVALFDLRRFQEAVQQDVAALKLDDGDYQNWGNLGEHYYYAGDKVRSAEAYKKAIPLAAQQLKLNPRDSVILADLAYYYSMVGDRKLALNYLDRSLLLGHSDKQLLFSAAQVYNQLRDTGPALELLSKALDADYSRSVVDATVNFDNVRDSPRYQTLMQHR